MANILIVDDDVNLLQVLKLSLEQKKYKVTTAGSGFEAMKAVKDGFFDLAVIDYQ